jgi:hypothetical protein
MQISFVSHSFILKTVAFVGLSNKSCTFRLSAKDSNGETLLKNIRTAAQDTFKEFTASDCGRIKDRFANSGRDPYPERWGNQIAALIRTHIETKVERLAAGILRIAMDDAFTMTKKLNCKDRQEREESRRKAVDSWEQLSLGQPPNKLFALVDTERLATLQGRITQVREIFKGDRGVSSIKDLLALDAWSWEKVLGALDSLESLYRESFPEWPGYESYPAIKKRWRSLTSSYELRRAPTFSKVRAAITLWQAKCVTGLDKAAAQVLQNPSLEGIHGGAWTNTSTNANSDWASVLRFGQEEFAQVSVRTRLDSRHARLLHGFSDSSSGKLVVVTVLLITTRFHQGSSVSRPTGLTSSWWEPLRWPASLDGCRIHLLASTFQHCYKSQKGWAFHRRL